MDYFPFYKHRFIYGRKMAILYTLYILHAYTHTHANTQTYMYIYYNKITQKSATDYEFAGNK